MRRVKVPVKDEFIEVCNHQEEVGTLPLNWREQDFLFLEQFHNDKAQKILVPILIPASLTEQFISPCLCSQPLYSLLTQALRFSEKVLSYVWIVPGGKLWVCYRNSEPVRTPVSNFSLFIKALRVGLFSKRLVDYTLRLEWQMLPVILTAYLFLLLATKIGSSNLN